MHAYRNLAADDAATTFQIDDYYYFTTTTPIQALEFTMNKWVSNMRFEWAMQWENIGGGSPPPWRLWTGSAWQSTGYTQSLAVNTWHHIQIKGTVVSGQVHYVSFISDSLSASLGQNFNPVSSTGDKLALAIQLDSDSHGDATTFTPTRSPSLTADQDRGWASVRPGPGPPSRSRPRSLPARHAACRRESRSGRRDASEPEDCPRA
jgi:hypothetical protein